MKNLKKMALALTAIFALSCGGALAAELVIVGHDLLLAEEGFQTWLGELAEKGIATRLVSEADFEAVKTSPYLAVFIVHNPLQYNLDVPPINIDLLPIVVTGATQRINLDASGNRKLFCFENRLAPGQTLLVFSSPGMYGVGSYTIFEENKVELEARLSPLIP